MATRYFKYRFSGVHQLLGPISGLSYHFAPFGATPVADERDAQIFLLMGTPESGVYLLRETDAEGNPIGPFPPIDPEKRQTMIDPKKFPSDRLDIPSSEWRRVTETFADPWLYYHYIRDKGGKSKNQYP